MRIENRTLLAPGKSAELAKKGKSVHSAKHYVLRGQGRKTPLRGLQVNEKILSEARDGCGKLLLDETCRLALFLGTRTRTRTNTIPYDTKANAAG